MSETTVTKDQLRIGLFIHLDLPWMAHPFFSNSFKIKNQKQLKTLRQLDLKQVRVDPARSDPPPSGAPAAAEPPPAAEAANGTGKDTAADSLWEEKKRRIAILKERRTRLNQCAKKYTKSVGMARKLMSCLRSAPGEAAREADTLIELMVEDLATDQETRVQLVNLKSQDENSYFHCINVATLALTLGQNLGLDKEELRLLGLASLFHDLGHQQLPSQILFKKEPLTRPERLLYEEHPRFGVEIARRLGTIPKPVIEVIGSHHEYLDGSGYPEQLAGARIDQLTRIVTVVNRYDNLCNGVSASRGVSPHQAVSFMYSKERAKYDPKVLTTFITNLGVYPPGTAVALEDERIALVISINAEDLLKPNVMVYAPEIPREEALILDLAEEGLQIKKTLHRNDLTPDMLDYLNISDKLSYYVQPAAGARPRG